jgi:O-antigen/teichoic acid export membrane protein
MATGTALAMLALSAILGPWLIRVYGSNYNAGPWFIAAFMVAGVVQAPVNTLGNSMLAHDGQSTWMRITIAGFAALALSAAIGTAGGLGAWAGAVANIVNALLLGVLALVACRRRGLV